MKARIGNGSCTVITACVLIGEILQVKGNVSHLQIAAAAQFMRYVPVVTDNLLGKVDGWEVALVAREIDPAMPVVYM